MRAWAGWVVLKNLLLFLVTLGTTLPMHDTLWAFSGRDVRLVRGPLHGRVVDRVRDVALGHAVEGGVDLPGLLDVDPVELVLAEEVDPPTRAS